MNKTQTLKRFWISWVQLSDDYRPLQDPPQPENICAWWGTGFDASGNATLCAIVEAESEEKAQEYVRKAWDSNGEEIGGFRFIEERENDWLPNNRFPIDKDWEKKRLKIS